MSHLTTLTIKDFVANCFTRHSRRYSSLSGIHDCFEGCLLPRWSLPSCHFLAWSIHCELPRAMSSCMYYSRMVSTVCICLFLYINTYIIGFSWNAPSNDIDSGWFIQQSKAYTELLCDGYKIQELWDNYGIVGKIKVTILLFSCTMHYLTMPHLAIYDLFPMCQYSWFAVARYSPSTY